MAEIDDRYQALPFEEAIEFLEGKIALDTDTWRDGAGDIQDAFFTSAGAKGDLLARIHQATTTAISEGQRPEEFAKVFEEIAAGWEGNTPWRANLIYFQNLRQAYAVGRAEYQLDPDVLAAFPYLQAVHSGAAEPRPIHYWMNGRVWRAREVPIHFPDGFGCGCRWISLGDRDLEAEGLTVEAAGRGDQVSIEMPSGQSYAPVIQPAEGFDYEPGAAARGERRRDVVRRVAENPRTPGPIAEALRAWLAAFLGTDGGGGNG